MTEVLFDCRSCGLGDTVVAAWMAQGCNDADNDYNVVFRLGRGDNFTELCGFTMVERDDGAITFGGSSASYAYELSLKFQAKPPRPILWQSHTPFKVTPKRPIVRISERARTWAKEQRQIRAPGKPFVLLFPFAAYGSRCWHLQKWLRLAWALESQGLGTIATHWSQDGLKDFPFWIYGYAIEDVMALMQEADIVVANDSGTAHLAGTLGVRTIALMGPTDPECVFGYCPEIVPMQVSKEAVPCVGCHFAPPFMIACDHGCEALQMLGVKDVLTKIHELVQGGIPSKTLTTC